jgi:hypothetical protein
LVSRVITTTPSLTLVNTDHGSYYEAGGGEIMVEAGQPVQPKVVADVHVGSNVTHGALWLGGTFTETLNFDPVVGGIVTTDPISNEPDFDQKGWVPSTPVGVLSRLEDRSQNLAENLIVIPAQFNAQLQRQRVYTQVLYQTYHAPASVTDFTSPEIQTVSVSSTLTVTVKALDASDVVRVPVLWRAEGEYSWHILDLQAGSNQTWSGQIPYTGSKNVLFLVQALDGVGNVTLLDDNGYEFTITQGADGIYLPLIVK